MNTTPNRAQRRAAAKSKQQRAFNRQVGIMQFHTRLALASATAANEEDQQVLLTPALLQVDRLMNGTMTPDGFVDLNEANITAFCLAANLHKAGANAETKAILEPAQPVFEAAADALAEIGVRAAQRGKYLATEPELKSIRDSMDWFSALLEVTDRAHLARAVMDAGKMVDEKLRQNQRRDAA